MSANVLEVSEGLPRDGRIFDPPKVNEDNARTRYLNFIGSIIAPDTVRSRPWTKSGGIETHSPCLRYVKNFLRKGRITPLLRDTHDFVPYDLAKKTTDVDPLGAGYFGQPVPQGYIPPNLPPANGQFTHGFGTLAQGGPSPYGHYVGKLALPGEQIVRVLEGDDAITNTNMRRGVVEHRSLYGHDYKPQPITMPNGVVLDLDPEIWRIQRAIFPDYPLFLNAEGEATVLLDDIQRLLDAARGHSSLRATVDEASESLALFRDYALSTVKDAHIKMQELARGSGYVYRYTALDYVLIDQLGMERQDLETRKPVSGSNERLESMFEQWLAIQIEEKQANIEREKRLSTVPATVLDQNTMAAAPIAEPDKEVKMVNCEHCGEEVKAMGYGLHKTRWCAVLHPKEVETATSETKVEEPAEG